MEPLSDEELVARRRAETGSPGADRWLDELFARYHRRVALWCVRLSGDRESAADLAQEVFIKAFRGLDSYRGDSAFSTWLYSIARNHCFSELRVRASAPELIEDSEAGELPATGASALDDLERESSLRAARELLQSSLTETEAQVFTLHHVDELPLEAITRLLNLGNATGAKAYLVSARRKLARAVERWRAREHRARS